MERVCETQLESLYAEHGTRLKPGEGVTPGNTQKRFRCLRRAVYCQGRLEDVMIAGVQNKLLATRRRQLLSLAEFGNALVNRNGDNETDLCAKKKK